MIRPPGIGVLTAPMRAARTLTCTTTTTTTLEALGGPTARRCQAAGNRDDATMWRAIGIRGSATTAGTTAAWLMAGMTGTPRRTATAAMIGINTTPVVSQSFGCTPAGPSLVDDDQDAGADEYGVDLTQRRGENPDGATEQRVLATASNQAGE